MARWRIPFAGFLLALMGGFSYAWGVFIIPMEEKFGWTKAQASLPFTIFMLIFAIFMIPAGRLQDKIGPRIVSGIGAILFFLSYATASLVGRIPHCWWLIVTYGVIGGVACGLTYACVAPPARKWFPDKPGLAISFGVMGFGMAAIILAPLKANYLIPVHGIEGTFFLIAIITSIISLFAAWAIKNPPEGWAPPGYSHEAETHHARKIKNEISPRHILKSPVFWFLWLTFASVVAGGLVCIGLIPSYGKLIVGMTAGKAAIAMSIFAGFNGLGRPLAGFLSDKFGAVWVMIYTYIIQASIFFLFPVFAVTHETLYISSALLGWGYAVTLALFPSLTSICFGSRHLGVNYGIVFSAFGLGALAPTIGSFIFDVTKSFSLVFIAAGVMTGFGLLMCLVLKKKFQLA